MVILKEYDLPDDLKQKEFNIIRKYFHIVIFGFSKILNPFTLIKKYYYY